MKRIHREVACGDVFGERTVVAVLERRTGELGGSNERVAWQCRCGVRGESYVYNLRRAKLVCTHREEGMAAE